MLTLGVSIMCHPFRMVRVVFLYPSCYFLSMNAVLHKATDATRFSIPGGTSGAVYPAHPTGEQSVAHVHMDGVYPVVGYSINTRCTESLFMLQGSFRVRTDDTEHLIGKGDFLIILPGTKYRIEGGGEALDIITPAWDAKQNSIVSDETFTLTKTP